MKGTEFNTSETNFHHAIENISQQCTLIIPIVLFQNWLLSVLVLCSIHRSVIYLIRAWTVCEHNIGDDAITTTG